MLKDQLLQKPSKEYEMRQELERIKLTRKIASERSAEDDAKLKDLQELLTNGKKFALETHEEKLIYQHIKPDFNKIMNHHKSGQNQETTLSLLGAQLSEVYNRMQANTQEEISLRMQIKEL